MNDTQSSLKGAEETLKEVYYLVEKGYSGALAQSTIQAWKMAESYPGTWETKDPNPDDITAVGDLRRAVHALAAVLNALTNGTPYRAQAIIIAWKERVGKYSREGTDEEMPTPPEKHYWKVGPSTSEVTEIVLMRRRWLGDLAVSVTYGRTEELNRREVVAIAQKMLEEWRQKQHTPDFWGIYE